MKIAGKIGFVPVLVVIVGLSFALRLGDFVAKTEAQATRGEPVAKTEKIDAAVAEPPAPDEGSLEDEEAKAAAEARRKLVSATENEAAEARKIQKDRNLPPMPAQSFSDAEVEVLQKLGKRREELDARERSLAEREALLKASEDEFVKKAEELDALRAKLESLLDTQQKNQNDQMSKLVRTFENMKPSEAADILNSMEMDVLLTIIDRMNERKSAPILAAMKPDIARDVTTRLAEQKRLPANQADGDGAAAEEKTQTGMPAPPAAP